MVFPRKPVTKLTGQLSLTEILLYSEHYLSYGKSVGYAIVQIKSSTLFSGYLQSVSRTPLFFLLDEENRPYMANIVRKRISSFRPFLRRNPSDRSTPISLAPPQAGSPCVLACACLFRTGCPSAKFLPDYFSGRAFVHGIPLYLLCVYPFHYIPSAELMFDMETIAASGFQSSLQVDQPG